MAITEKNKTIEFSYSDDEGFRYDVVFNPLNKTIDILTDSGTHLFGCPVSLFFETIDFLIKKGCVANKPNFPSSVLCAGATQTPIRGIAQGVPQQKTSLPIPEIVKKGDSLEVQNQYKMQTPTDPVSSFNVIDASSESITVPQGLIDAAKARASEGDENFVDASEFFKGIEDEEEDAPTEPEKISETINRPVIRSRVKKGDPLSAEKEASDFRAGLSKSEKRVKRASDSESD